MLETLESRRLLTIDVTVTTTGTLAISNSDPSGNPGIYRFDQNDSITIDIKTSARSAFSNAWLTGNAPVDRVTILSPRGGRQIFENAGDRITDIEAALGSGRFVTVKVPITNFDPEGTPPSTTTSDLFIARLSDVRRILADAGEGDDLISASPRVKLPTTLIGGSGNDTLYGGGAYSLLSGGAGSDLIFARGTSSLIQAGGGDDIIYGRSRGIDNVSGGSGFDILETPGDDDISDSIEAIRSNGR